MKSPSHMLVVNLDDPDLLATLRRAMAITRSTQSQFAKLMGVTPHAVHYWLKGTNRVPKWATVAAIGACITAGVGVRVVRPAQTLYPQSAKDCDDSRK